MHLPKHHIHSMLISENNLLHCTVSMHSVTVSNKSIIISEVYLAGFVIIEKKCTLSNINTDH